MFEWILSKKSTRTKNFVWKNTRLISGPIHDFSSTLNSLHKIQCNSSSSKVLIWEVESSIKLGMFDRLKMMYVVQSSNRVMRTPFLFSASILFSAHHSNSILDFYFFYHVYTKHESYSMNHTECYSIHTENVVFAILWKSLRFKYQIMNPCQSFPKNYEQHRRMVPLRTHQCWSWADKRYVTCPRMLPSSTTRNGNWDSVSKQFNGILLGSKNKASNAEMSKEWHMGNSRRSLWLSLWYF